MPRVYQEFFCSGCKGFFAANINMALKKIVVVCPKCGRRHSRFVKDGVITDTAYEKFDGKREVEEIMPTMGSYRTEPLTARMREAESKGIKKQASNSIERNGVPFDAERWLEVAARERGEI